MILRKFLLLTLGLLILCPAKNWGQKINGLSFVGTRINVNKEHIDPVKETAANWVALMPYGYMNSAQDSSIKFDLSWQWAGETKRGINQTVPFFYNDGIEIMLKPHIWIRGGVFTGTIAFESDAAWSQFQKSYKEFILHFAQVAQDSNIALLCIGTELQSLVAYDPQFWFELIDDVKKIYTGKLTYAENWDQYHKVPFWGKLDYVGIDAYFPLKSGINPSLEELISLWKPYVQDLKNFSEKENRSILFTEIGYRSIHRSTVKPWDYSVREQPYNGKAQADALEAMFLSFQEKNWWAGGFIWKWFPDHANSGGVSDTTFSPQNKPAEDIIKRYFTNLE